MKIKTIFIIFIVLLLTSCQANNNDNNSAKQPNIDNIDDVAGLICIAKEPLGIIMLDDPDSLIYGYIQEGDKFEVYESKEINEEKYYRIGPNLWIINKNSIEISSNQESIVNKNISFYNIKKFPKSIETIPFDVNGDNKEKSYTTNVDFDDNGELKGLYSKTIDGGENYSDYFFPYEIDIYSYGSSIQHIIASNGMISREVMYGEGHQAILQKIIDFDINLRIIRINCYFDNPETSDPVESTYYLYNENNQLTFITSNTGDGEYHSYNETLVYNGNYVFRYLCLDPTINSNDLKDYFLGYVYRFDNEGIMLEYYKDMGNIDDSSFSHTIYDY